MKQDMRNNGMGANKVLGQLAADKKKVVVALFLIAVMGFMWVRVLAGKGPQSAEATAVPQALMNEKTDSELKISFVELPKVEGRNDVLGRDFFAVESWKDFTAEDGGEVNIVSGNYGEEAVKKAAEKLKLEAIVSGGNPRAFINDKLVVVGDKLGVADGVNKYEFEVTEITEKMVLISYGKVEIVLKLIIDDR